MVWLVLVFTANIYAQVGIGTSNPASSAQLDVTSTTSGFLPPRMTFAQRNAIPNPATGLVVWCIDCDELQIYNGTIWKNLAGRIASPPSPPNVTICDQDWMVRNLDVSTYKNGDPIPKVTDDSEWAALTTGAYCYYNNDSTTYAATYGKLYNWYAVNDPRGLGPPGWHVASDAEWATLSDCLGGETVAGGPMKEIGTTHWNSPNSGATNLSGFTGLPGGCRFSDGFFFWIDYYCYLWSSTEYFPGSVDAWYRLLFYDDNAIFDDYLDKHWGLSVRCLKD